MNFKFDKNIELRSNLKFVRPFVRKLFHISSLSIMRLVLHLDLLTPKLVGELHVHVTLATFHLLLNLCRAFLDFELS